MADLTKYSSQAGIPYAYVETVDISSIDHTFSDGPARALIITSSGNVVIQMHGDGGQLTIPVVVTASHYHELRGYMIEKVIKSGTTATVSYGMK